jgi:hypothetical protein
LASSNSLDSSGSKTELECCVFHLRDSPLKLISLLSILPI